VQNRTADTSRPSGVDSAITHSSYLSSRQLLFINSSPEQATGKNVKNQHTNFIPILDNTSPLTPRIVHLERAHIAHVAIRRVRNVHYQRHRCRRRNIPCAAVATKENRPIVQPRVHKSVDVRHSREIRAIGDREQATLVRGHEGGAVGPILADVLVQCVGAGVDREDDVYVALGLGERVEGQILEIFAAVDEGEDFRKGDFAGGWVDADEGIGVGGDVI